MILASLNTAARELEVIAFGDMDERNLAGETVLKDGAYGRALDVHDYWVLTTDVPDGDEGFLLMESHDDDHGNFLRWVNAVSGQGTSSFVSDCDRFGRAGIPIKFFLILDVLIWCFVKLWLRPDTCQNVTQCSREEWWCVNKDKVLPHQSAILSRPSQL